MEFDSNTAGDRSPDISDEARQEASARQKSVAPIHDDIVAEDLPDEVIANQHIVQGPLANAANDSEATVGGSRGVVTPEHHHHFILILCGITIVIITVLIYIH